MKKINVLRNKRIIFIFVFISFIFMLHFSTYEFDKKQITLDKEPIFCINTGELKDGGTKFFYGFGYQIIKWNYLDEKTINGVIVDGISHGFEIHRIPSFVDWTKGANIDLEFIRDNYTKR